MLLLFSMLLTTGGLLLGGGGAFVMPRHTGRLMLLIGAALAFSGAVLSFLASV